MIKSKDQKKCKECGKLFKAFKTTDKYCSFICSNKGDTKQLKAKEQTKIKARSMRRKAEEALYNKNRITFLEAKENRVCRVCEDVFGIAVNATEIHHKAGRIGPLLNDQSFWMAVSRKGHLWIHDNPQKAYELGYLIHSSTIKNK